MKVNIGFPVVRTDGQAAGGRAVYDHVITKFSGMGRFTKLWGSAHARAWSSATIYHSLVGSGPRRVVVSSGICSFLKNLLCFLDNGLSLSIRQMVVGDRCHGLEPIIFDEGFKLSTSILSTSTG